MLALDDSRWTEFMGGYRVKYDARPLLDRFKLGKDEKECWNEVWNILYHQYNIDLASYAFFPHIVDVYANRPRTFDLYSYAERLELCKGRYENPSIPIWMLESHKFALTRLGHMIPHDLFYRDDSDLALSIGTFVFAVAGRTDISAVLENIDHWINENEGQTPKDRLN